MERIIKISTIIIIGIILTVKLNAGEWNPKIFRYEKSTTQSIERIPVSKEELYQYGRQPLIELLRCLNNRGKFENKENYHLQKFYFTNDNGEEIPCLLSLPLDTSKGYPVILLAHGLTSNKEQMSYWFAGQLTELGFATLALDFPHHGERKGNTTDIGGKGNLDLFYKNIRGSVIELYQLIDIAEKLPELNTANGVGLIGYSMGSWISTLAGSADSRIRILVLMAGGGIPNYQEEPENFNFDSFTQRQKLFEKYPDLRPDLAIPNFSPRPVFMLNGENDLLVPRDSAESLYDSARVPKKMNWYDSGHILPLDAFIDASKWIQEKIKILYPLIAN